MIKRMLSIVAICLCFSASAEETAVNFNVFGGITYVATENEPMFKSQTLEFGINAVKNWGDTYVKAQISTRPEQENQVAIDWLYGGYVYSDHLQFEAGLLDTPLGFQSQGVHNPFSRYAIQPAANSVTVSKGFANLIEGVGIKGYYKGFEVAYRAGKPRFSPPETRSLMESTVTEIPIMDGLDWGIKHSINIDYNKNIWDFRLSYDTITFEQKDLGVNKKRWSQYVLAAKRQKLTTDSLIEFTYIKIDPILPEDLTLLPSRLKGGSVPYSKGNVIGLYMYHGVEVFDRVMIYGLIDLFYLDHKSKHADWYESIENRFYTYPKELRYTEDFALGVKYYFKDNMVLAFEWHKTRGAISNQYSYWTDPRVYKDYPTGSWNTYMMNISFVF